jgi:hypothetical protein
MNTPPRDLRRMLQDVVSETLDSRLTPISRPMSFLTKRLERVEWGPGPRTNQLTPAATTTASSTYHPARLWADRPLRGEPLPNLPDRWEDDEEEEAEHNRDETREQESAEVVAEPLASDPDDAEGCPLHQLLASTEAILSEAFCKLVPNSTRRRWRKAYGMPAIDATKCPKLDSTLHTQVPKEGRDNDDGSGCCLPLIRPPRTPPGWPPDHGRCRGGSYTGPQVYWQSSRPHKRGAEETHRWSFQQRPSAASGGARALRQPHSCSAGKVRQGTRGVRTLDS